jgi:radical SAM protein (TIGR01212 family)
MCIGRMRLILVPSNACGVIHMAIKYGWYYRLSEFFRKRFGRRIYKIPVHAAFTCPNRDGTIGSGGCTFCYNPSFSLAVAQEGISVREQVEQARAQKKKKYPKARFLVYFQSYTNTYGEVEHLRNLYDQALAAAEDIVGLAIATRPDCVNREILDILEGYAKRYHLWLEYGLQSAHNATLDRINRGHDCETFIKAVQETKGRGIFISAHIILGLPGERREQMRQTVELLNRLAVDGVKFHHLQVVKNTPLANDYLRGQVQTLTLDEYIPLICDLLEHLSPRIVVHRLVGETLDHDLLLAPHWEKQKSLIIQDIESELKRRKSYQGFLYRKL